MPGNYYDEQFGSRIDSIRKPGSAPTPVGGGGGAGKGGCVGPIIFAIIFVVIRVMSSSRPSYTPPSYNYTPPPRFDAPKWQQPQFDPNPNDPLREFNERQRRHEQLFKDLDNRDRLPRDLNKDQPKADGPKDAP
jgi:hypothetical protein